MKIYFASMYNDKSHIWKNHKVERILLSYHYIPQTQKTLNYCKQNNLCENLDLILDSGAFSCWNKGIEIDLQNYMNYIIKIKHNYNFRNFYAVNLDVIPGSKGCKITKEMAHESMMKGWDNYLYLKKHGVDTIHVYHQGESEDFLMNTIIKECDYIGVSPSNDASTAQKMMWCEHIFDLLPGHIKSHGFAVTSVRLMTKFPWYSVDSASWCRKSGFGNILTTQGELVFSTKGRKSYLSEYISLKEIGLEKLKKEIASYGIELGPERSVEDHIKYDSKLRDRINYCFIKSQEDRLNRIEGKDDKFQSKQLLFF
jgi:hypothetical protein